MSYTTKAKVVEMAGGALIEADIKDNWLADADDEIHATTGKVYTETTVTSELHNGNAAYYLFLDHYPITTLTAVSIDSVAADVSNMFYETNTIGFKSTTLVASFTKGYKNVSVDYKHGDIERIETAQKLATLLVAVQALQAKGANSSKGLESEKVDKYTLRYGRLPYSGLIKEYKDKIEKYFDLLGRKINYEVT